MELNLAHDYRLLERDDTEEKIRVLNFPDEKHAKIINRLGQVKKVRTAELDSSNNGWFYSHLSRPFAEQMLLSKKRQIGSFVVRSSQTKNGFALSVKLTNSKIGHFLIDVDSRTGNVMIWNMTFGSIQHLVRYFTQRPFYESVHLVMHEKKHKTGRLVFETLSENQWELSLSYNANVEILAKIDANWLLVQSQKKKIGLVPRNHVEILKH